MVDINKILPDQAKADIVKFNPEGDKERIQTFEGDVLSIRGEGSNRTFTVRKISSGVGVERIFPINSPKIAKIEVLKEGNVRRAKLYYLRNLSGKAARIRGKEA